MARVDFSDFIQSKTWFETQNTTTMTLVANRAALRVAANLSFASKEVFDVLTLATMRSLIITAVRALDLRTDINWTRIASSAHAAIQNNLSTSCNQFTAQNGCVEYRNLHRKLSFCRSLGSSNFVRAIICAYCILRYRFSSHICRLEIQPDFLWRKQLEHYADLAQHSCPLRDFKEP